MMENKIEAQINQGDPEKSNNTSRADHDASSSASSVYSTAEEDFEVPTDEDESIELIKTVEEPIAIASKAWVTGSVEQLDGQSDFLNSSTISVSSTSLKGSNKQREQINFHSRSKTNAKKKGNMGRSNSQQNLRIQICDGNPNKVINDISDVSSSSTASGLNQFHPNPKRMISLVTTTDDDDDEFKSLDSWAPDGKVITVAELQRVFDCFKSNDLSSEECEKLIDLLGVSQSRNDFQWALHQLGGFNALLFLYARVVEVCTDDDIQSKGLSLALGQIKNHSKVTDVPPITHYNLLRFVLNNEKSTFGFKTFIILVHHCLTPSGNKLIDYELLNTCLLSSWRALTRVRCTEADSPTGRRCLFECLLTVLLDLLLEKNNHRLVNIALLKSKKFADRILAICCNLIFESGDSDRTDTSETITTLSSIEALRISALIKSIFSELMAPPDAYVAISIVNYGLFPLLPKDLPPLPRKQNAFFVYQNKISNNTSEAEEILENHMGLMKPNKYQPSQSNNVVMKNEDIPEIVGRVLNNSQKVYDKESFDRSQKDGFRETFQESLVEALMSVLLNTLAIIPDGAFFSVLRPHLNSNLFLAYCSHSNSTIKVLSLKLISSYLSRVKNPCIAEFLKNKGFYLMSMYTQDVSEIYPIVSSICQGFGPVSYPLVVGLLHSQSILTTVLQWIQEDVKSVIPALLSMGLIPALVNQQRSATTLSLSRPMSVLISHVIHYCVLNPKEDPWKILFCPAIESVPSGSQLSARFYQEAITFLKDYRGDDLKKKDINSRLLWLLERGSASRFGSNFDKWLLNLFTLHFMEMVDEAESDVWKNFTRKNKKRLTFIMGILLCKIFTPNKGEFDMKQQTVRELFESCTSVHVWLPKVLRCDASIERCFTAFLRIFLVEANQRECPGNDDARTRSPSLNQLITDSGGRLAAMQSHHQIVERTENYQLESMNMNPDEIYQSQVQFSDKTCREKLESILVNAGVLSPTTSFSTFSADFKKFKILLETPPICGISYHELRHCHTTLDKLRMNLIPFTSMPKDKELSPGKGYCCNAKYFESIFDAVSNFAIEIIDNVTRIRTTMGIEIIKSVCTRDSDIIARACWWALMEQMTHPRAPWHFPEMYPKFWSLDQSEGPGRVRIRLQREHLKIHSRFVLPKNREPNVPRTPLEYLFKVDQECDDLMSFPTIKTEIQYMRFCTRIIPGEEICGEIILSRDMLYFIPESSDSSNSEKHETIEVPLTSLNNILRRRYTLEDRGAEIFFFSRNFLFAFRNFKDREEFLGFISVKQISNSLAPNGRNAVINDATLISMTARWNKGQISNFEYLMYLNTAAGRTYCDLMQYPVFPFVLAKYDTPTLDLHAPQSYRDLKKPMAIQDPSKEEHFLSTYNYLKRECDSTPFHYGSHYSNSGIVLHFLIRLPPYTQHFLRYQDGSFDIPDRSFHSIETTWRLASRESNTDFKEAIPEFFYLPEFLQNLQHFDFGVRQNGKRVDDVVLPPWSKGDPRIFTLVNRQALESNQVRKCLSDWIDLIFGYKQTGKAAIQSINVFHPSTYEGFEVEGVGDELMRRARKAMVSTYGQTPKKLFPYPHLRSIINTVENCETEVLDTVWGIRWGTFLGSPTCVELEVVNTREYTNSMALFENPTRIVFWPVKTLIMGDKVVGTWSSNEIQIKSKVIYICIGDEITSCSTTEDSIWMGHQSGRIRVLRLSHGLDTILDTVDLVGHYKPIKEIDLNTSFSIAVSCSGEDYAIIWDMNRIVFLNVIQRKSTIDAVYSSRSTGDIILQSVERNTVTLTTINGFEIGTVRPEEKVESVCLSSLDPGTNVNLFAIGCDYGYIRFYSTWDMKFINQIKVLPLASLPIHCIRYSKDGKRLYCLSTSEEISISAALQLPDSQK